MIHLIVISLFDLIVFEAMQLQIAIIVIDIIIFKLITIFIAVPMNVIIAIGR